MSKKRVDNCGQISGVDRHWCIRSWGVATLIKAGKPWRTFLFRFTCWTSKVNFDRRFSRRLPVKEGKYSANQVFVRFSFELKHLKVSFSLVFDFYKSKWNVTFVSLFCRIRHYHFCIFTSCHFTFKFCHF